MLVQLAIIGLLCIVLWLVTKRRDSMFRIRRPRTAAWFDRRVAEWKGALTTVSSATSKDDAVAKLKAARDSKKKPSLERRIYTSALRQARSTKYPQVPQIVDHFNKVIARLNNSKMHWLSRWLKSKHTRHLMIQEQIADAKKYGNVNDFVAAYQKKVNDLMAKKTTSTFQGEENIPDALRIQMYQKAIGDMQKAGSIDAFIKSRQGAIGKLKKAARHKRAKMASKQVGGNYYFYFNSMK